jgi:hypothetical protein
MRGMSRLAVIVLLLSACACTKKSTSQEAAGKPGGTEPAGTKIGGEAPPTNGARQVGAPGGEPVKAGDDSRFRLQPDEGKLAIELPASAKPNTEATAKIVVIPGSEYKVNTEFPTKLTLESPSGVTLAKAELKAGGMDKSKGDADVFEEAQLVFAVKLTPAATGTYTVNGTFKFAVCDKAGSTCLAKKEPIAIQVAAN